MNEYSYVYIAPDGDLNLSQAEGEGLFRKEVIYEGNFVLQDSKGGRFQQQVDASLLHHWARTGAEFLADGNKIPVPVEHTRDPEKNRGEVVKLAVENNSRGGRGLFAYVKFHKPEYGEQLKNSQVSIWVDPEFVSGSGKKFYRPIRHVALTDYPIIPKLDSFEAIAASFVKLGDEEMPMKALAKSLGIEVDDNAKDEDIQGKIAGAFKNLQTKVKDLEAKVPKKDPEPKPEPKKTDDPPKKVAAGLLSMAKDLRETKLSQLVEKGKITPAVAGKLKDQYCSDEKLELCLSDDSVSDGFDETIAALSENEEVLSFAEKSGAQVADLKLGEVAGGEESPLVKDAERRAKEAAPA